ncbi:MAG: ergothioneine biosynthesis protein EgtB [Nitrosopumilus sp. B06]|nr:MAG: ergothioneine biosynthesis protein EgtB [Nitrosopumilus sp. B06]
MIWDHASPTRKHNYTKSKDAHLLTTELQTPLLEQFTTTRTRTLELVRTLEKDDFVIQTARYASPPKWHIGHVSWIHEVVLSKIDPSYEFYSKEFSDYLNSYYQQFGVPHDKGQRGASSRPTTHQIFQYFDAITKKMTDTLVRNITDEQKKLVEMGCHHECQHQELLIYDIQHMLADQYRPVKKNQVPVPVKIKDTPVSISGGLYTMGYNKDRYCYDVELPEHKVYLNDYTLDRYPVTNSDYIRFIEDGGYNTYKYWLSDGWEKVKENKWQAPMYWTKIDNKWHTRNFAGTTLVHPDEPVCHVSYYEADAYSKWAGKRLPTEAEWEKAACWNDTTQKKTVFPWGDESPTPQRCNLLESYHWRCAPIGAFPDGASHAGCQQMIGDIWEWTSSEFAGYPGFKSGFDEYNDKWFTGQKVLRGGSFGTPQMSIRGSYRNFFRLDERWMFAGFRCAQGA